MEKKFLSPEFWSMLSDNIIIWSSQFLPKFIFLLLLLFISLSVYKFLIKKIKRFFITRAEKTLEDYVESEKRINTLMSITRKTGIVTIWVVFIMMILNASGFDIAPILAGAGIVGLAVGFGAQTLVKDVITGFFILLEDQLRVGDVANINGISGVVEEMQLRTILLRDFSGVVHIIETGLIKQIANHTKEWSASVIDFGIGYSENSDKVVNIIRQTADKMYQEEQFKDKFLLPIEIFGIEKLDNSAVVIRTRMKTKPHQQWNLAREFRRRMKFAFDENNIEIPFPQTSLHWNQYSKPMEIELKNAV